MPATAIRELSDFLVEAKRRTYAVQGDNASVAPVLPGSKQLEYGDGEFTYRDIYFGMSRFVGQALVSRDGEPIWSMAYAGGLIVSVGRPAEPRPIFGFLRKALLLVDAQRPSAAPLFSRPVNSTMSTKATGDIGAFRGTERISRNGTPVYRLDYAGGVLQA